MKLAPFLAIITLASPFSFAAEPVNKLCSRYVADLKLRSTFDLFRSAEKNHADLTAVARFMQDHQDMFEGLAKSAKDFDFVKDTLKKGGMPLGQNELPYYERLYQKLFVAKNCPETNLEAGSGMMPDGNSSPGTFPEPGDDFYGRHVDDATRGTTLEPGQTTPAETER